MTQWCYGLKCLGLELGYTDDTTICRDAESSDSWYRVGLPEYF